MIVTDRYTDHAKKVTIVYILYYAYWCGLILIKLRTRQWTKQPGISHLFFPDHRQDVLHPLGTPQEVEHSQVHHHTLARKDCTNVARDVVLQTEYIPPSVARRHLQVTRLGFIFHTTQNRSFQRCASPPISWHGTKETKPNTTKSNTIKTKWSKQKTHEYTQNV